MVGVAVGSGGGGSIGPATVAASMTTSRSACWSIMLSANVDRAWCVSDVVSSWASKLEDITGGGGDDGSGCVNDATRCCCSYIRLDTHPISPLLHPSVHPKGKE